MAARPLIGWYIFDFTSETAERNSTTLDTKQDLIILYQVRVLGPIKKKQAGTPASDWLRHFPPLLKDRWMEFNETWQEVRF